MRISSISDKYDLHYVHFKDEDFFFNTREDAKLFIMGT